MKSPLIVYFDYKSPYAYVAKDLIWKLGDEFDIELDWRPFNLNIADAFGNAEFNDKGELLVDERNAHQWRRVRYMYMDCRRLAKQRGLTLKPPSRIFASVPAHVGALYAQRHGKFRAYHDTVFSQFWKRELDIDSVEAIAQTLQSVGVDSGRFAEFERGEGRVQLDKLMNDAHERGVFGVPTFLIEGSMYWGSEHLPAIRQLIATSLVPNVE